MPVVDSFLKRRSRTLLGKKAIILDDVTDLCILFKKVLELSGLEVVLVAQSGEELIEQLSRTKSEIDFALVDYNLNPGGMNGIQTAMQLKRRYLGMRIIIVTAESSIRIEAMSCGFQYLQKPFGLNELLDILENA